MAQKHISSLMNQYQKDAAAESNFTELYGAIGGSYQPLNSILTSISGLATNVTGLIKLTNGVASLDTNTYALASAIPTSINGLSGGSLTSPLVIKGGDGAGAAKIALDHTQSGQITDESTKTLFGFTTNGTTTLTIGHSSYAMALRGSGTRPTYNGSSLALYSDLPAVNNGTLTIKQNGTTRGTFTANQSGNTTADIDTHHPNLLINPDFAINQRGSATYTGANKYTCDRWIVYQASSACVVTPRTSGGVKVDNSTGSTFATFRQYIEEYSKLGSKTLTISLYVNSKNGDVKIFAAGLTSSTTYSNVLNVGLNTLTINTIVSPTATQIGLNLPAYSWIDIAYMKVEIGNVATTFSPPVVAEELVKCQRYYWEPLIISNASNIVIGSGVCYSGTYAYFSIPIPTMRTTGGTFSVQANKLKTYTTGTATPSAAIKYSQDANCLGVRTQGSYTAGQSVLLLISTEEHGVITLDAEIY